MWILLGAGLWGWHELWNVTAYELGFLKLWFASEMEEDGNLYGQLQE